MADVVQHTKHIGDVDLFYREAGSRGDPSILLLHGGRFHSGTWHDLGTLDTLSQNGYHPIAVDLPGYGQSPESTLEPLAFMVALIDSLNLHRPAVVSPSMSGRFSLPLATERSDLIGAYIPVAPAGIKTRRDHLRQIAVPTLIVWGTHDTVIPLSQSDALHRAISGSQTLLIKDASHPCYLDKPDVFHRGILDFLDSLNPSTEN